MTANGFKLGLIGYPIEHSLSPRLHQAALQSVGLTGEYRLFPIIPGLEGVEKMTTLVDLLRQQEIHGLNVTIPYKEEITTYLDELTPTARAIGATNTLVCLDGRAVGDNTDAPGFWADLTRLFPHLAEHPARALILGAGGTARAVAYALLQAGWEISIASRRIEQAKELIHGLSSTLDTNIVRAVHLTSSAIGAWLASSRESHPGNTLIVNATPVGMSPYPNASPWPEGLPMPEAAIVYDLVYNPAETALVRQARQRGLKAVNGLGMLVEQAALAFECWTGKRPDRQAMYNAVSNY